MAPEILVSNNSRAMLHKTCPKCGGSCSPEQEEYGYQWACFQCGNRISMEAMETICNGKITIREEIMANKREIGKYYLDHKSEILEDMVKLGVVGMRKKRGMPAGTWGGLKKRWGVDDSKYRGKDLRSARAKAAGAVKSIAAAEAAASPGPEPGAAAPAATEAAAAEAAVPGPEKKSTIIYAEVPVPGQDDSVMEQLVKLLGSETVRDLISFTEGIKELERLRGYREAVKDLCNGHPIRGG